MKITPLDIYNKEFRKKFSLWAYDGREVDEFLDRVAGAYEQLLKDLNQLKDENVRLKADMTRYQQMEKTLQETLIVAQETVKERKDQAEREAVMIVENAKVKAQEILSEANEGAKDRIKKIQQLKEYEEFFRIRMTSLLNSHLQLLEKSETEVPEAMEDLKREVAAGFEEEFAEEDLDELADLEDLELDIDDVEEDLADELDVEDDDFAEDPDLAAKRILLANQA